MRLIDADALEAHLNRRLKDLRADNGEHDHYTDGYDEVVCVVEDFLGSDAA